MNTHKKGRIHNKGDDIQRGVTDVWRVICAKLLPIDPPV